MTTQTDVKSVYLPSTGGSTLAGIGGANPTLGVRVKGVYWSGTTAGSVSLNDGSSTGTTRIQMYFPNGTTHALLPGEGVRFTNDVYVAFGTAVGNLTLFYG